MSNATNHDAACPQAPPLLRRVQIRGYKSIAFCDVTLEPLTLLVGRNASGKSNFLDALAFLRDVVRFGLAEALGHRGGWPAVVCQGQSPEVIELAVELGWSETGDVERNGTLGSNKKFTYKLRFASHEQHTFIAAESFTGWCPEGKHCTRFEVVNGQVQDWRFGSEDATRLDPTISALLDSELPDRPLLSLLGSAPFAVVADSLRKLCSYNFHPNAIRQPQKSTPGQFLAHDGHNLASVIESTRAAEPWAIERAAGYLTAIHHNTEFSAVLRVGDYETLRFRVCRENQDDRPLEFGALAMSDGTLRTLAALVAVFQIIPSHGTPSLVSIEEPDASLHPSAMNALVDALDEATSRTQVLLTTHNVEMLDNTTVAVENVRVVKMINGETVIGSVDGANAAILRRKLNSVGGLEKSNLLEPCPDDIERQRRLRDKGVRGCERRSPRHDAYPRSNR